MNKRIHMIIVKIGKKIDMTLGILGIMLIGIAFGYAWCWCALN